MEIRAARLSDVELLCGQVFNESMRAIVVEHDGEPVAIAGVLHTNPLQAFSHLTPAVRKSPKTIVRAVDRMQEIVEGYTAPVYAVASDDPLDKDPGTFLEYVGFQYVGDTAKGRLYLWVGQQQQ